MSKLINHSKAVWLPLIFVAAWITLSTSLATAQQIQWRQDLAKAKAEARDTNRLVWLHFTADWCIPCKRIETFVFSSTGVIRAADRNTVAVNIDADANESLVKQLEVPRIPYDVFMTPSGRVILDRASPEDITSFLTMLNSLDRPLQELTDGDREVINARIDKLHSIIDQPKGLRQTKSDLDLDKPSHQMAPTTVEGQRLERGFHSAARAAEMQAVEAQLRTKRASNYIAEQTKQKGGGQAPKISENPFFKSSDSAEKIILPRFGGQSPLGSSSSPKTVTNMFVKQNQTTQPQPTQANQNFVPPLPLTIGKKEAVAEAQDLNSFEERKEFSFAETKKPNANANHIDPKFTLPKLAELNSSLPKPPEFKDGSGKKANSNDFAYAPIDKLRQTLRTETQPLSNSFKKPIDNSFQSSTAKSLSLEMPAQQTSRKKLAWDLPRPAIKEQTETFAEFEKPAMKTAVSIPKAPVMVEGVVRIAETRVPAVEGRLVAAEQSLDEGSMVRTSQAQDTIQKQLSRTDRLLEGVNFFAAQSEASSRQSGPNTFAVPGQPVAQPQIVINLNAGNAATTPPAQTANSGVVIQPNFAAPSNPNQVAQASNATSVNRAKITQADIAAAARSKYALKGKCPVTLMTEGRWADGNKEIGCVHRDRVYLFATAAHREAFLANPDKLSPLLAGFDPVIFEETGKLIEGEEKFGTFMGKKPNQRIVLFKTADTRERFQKEPSKYLNVVRQAMTGSVPKDIKLR